MSEGFKEPVLKTGDGATHRGFESHSLRQQGRGKAEPLPRPFLLFFQNLYKFDFILVPVSGFCETQAPVQVQCGGVARIASQHHPPG